MKSPLLISFLLAIAASVANAQDTPVLLNRDIPYRLTYFTTNPAGELFVINTANDLIKYNTGGDSVGVFNDVKKYGKLSYVEAQNPWKTLLFYENFQTIVLLDKYLKNLGSIKLPDKGIFDVRAVTTSYDNRIWVFDGREFKIKKLDDNGNTLMASIDLRQVLDVAPSPVWMGDKEGFLYLYDPENGMYVFDYYGSFRALLPFKNWTSVYPVGKELIGFDAEHLYRYTPPIPMATQKKLPIALRNATQIGIAGQRIYVLSNGKLRIYEM